MSEQPFLQVRNIERNFRIGSHILHVLKGVSFSTEKGEWLSLTGASGSGKTTLLDIIGTIARPDSGELMIAGTDVLKLSRRKVTAFRREKIGFVFQAYHLLPELNILENVMLPAMLDGKNGKAVRTKAEKLLERVGLSARLLHRSAELSGGEQQRAAIARSLMNDPELLLADEPTGNLDSGTGRGILEIFRELHASASLTIVMVTHDPGVASMADRQIELCDGMILQKN